jgi:hypothetical protein
MQDELIKFHIKADAEGASKRFTEAKNKKELRFIEGESTGS